MTYKVIRFAQHAPARTIHTGLTLEEAQAICRDPQTSSRTATGATARERTRRLGGAWFYGYDKER